MNPTILYKTYHFFDYPEHKNAKDHPLAERPYISAADFTNQTVVTYPVPIERLDLFNELLMPKGIERKATRQNELTSIILLLVSANKGVSVLPDWVLQSARDTELLAQRKLTKSGITRKLYAAVRTRESEKLYIESFLSH